MDKYLTSNILEFLTIDEKIKLFRTTNDNGKLIKLKIFKSFDEIHIRQYFKNTIFDKKIIYNLPILTYRENYSSGDYIDCIKNKNLNYPIMIGVDDWNRPFITFKVKNQKHFAITIFQRFSDCKRTWAVGGLVKKPPEFMYDEGHVNPMRIYKLPKNLYRYILKNAVI